MTGSSKAIALSVAVSALGAIVGGVSGFAIGKVFDSPRAEFFGTLLGVATGAGISGGITAWRIEKHVERLNGAGS